jgi:hypothetical protein
LAPSHRIPNPLIPEFLNYGCSEGYLSRTLRRFRVLQESAVILSMSCPFIVIASRLSAPFPKIPPGLPLVRGGFTSLW